MIEPKPGSLWRAIRQEDLPMMMPRQLRVHGINHSVLMDEEEVHSEKRSFVETESAPYIFRLTELYLYYEEVTDPEDIGFFLLQEMP